MREEKIRIIKSIETVDVPWQRHDKVVYRQSKPMKRQCPPFHDHPLEVKDISEMVETHVLDVHSYHMNDLRPIHLAMLPGVDDKIFNLLTKFFDAYSEQYREINKLEDEVMRLKDRLLGVKDNASSD